MKSALNNKLLTMLMLGAAIGALNISAPANADSVGMCGGGSIGAAAWGPALVADVGGTHSVFPLGQDGLTRAVATEPEAALAWVRSKLGLRGGEIAYDGGCGGANAVIGGEPANNPEAFAPEKHCGRGGHEGGGGQGGGHEGGGGGQGGGHEGGGGQGGGGQGGGGQGGGHEGGGGQGQGGGGGHTTYNPA